MKVSGTKSGPSIAVLIPCLNEESTIGKVVADFRTCLPNADIYVCDNGSTDKSAEIALASGACLLKEKRRGKGNAIRRMFEEIDSDVYIMVDGDDTYPAEEAAKLIQPIINEEADMVVATRLEHADKGSFTASHRFGNKLLRSVLNLCFNANLSDILSGYRVMNRDFVKTIPITSRGFEIEAELTLQALSKGFVIKEIPAEYRSRHKGSESKIRTFTDGYAILMTIIAFTRDFRPMFFFPMLSLLSFISGLIPGIRVIKAYLKTGQVHYISSAILAASLMTLSIFFFITGFFIHTVNRRFNEISIMLKHTKRQ
ncbi:glycosyltransferase [bacterium]|nr:glycosyltransferase [bacterium]